MSKIEKTELPIRENATDEKPINAKTYEEGLKDGERTDRIKKGETRNNNGLFQSIKDFFKPYNLGFAEDIAIIVGGHIAKQASLMKCYLSNENLAKLMKGEKTDFVSYHETTKDGQPYTKQVMLQLGTNDMKSLAEDIKADPNISIKFHKWSESKEIKPNTIFTDKFSVEQLKELKENHFLVEPVVMKLGKDVAPNPYKVFVNERSSEISAIKFNPLVNRLSSVLMNIPIGQKIEQNDSPQIKAEKKQANQNTIIDLMAGESKTYMKGDKEVTVYFDPITNRIENPYTSVFNQQHFKAYVTEQKILSEDMMLNKHQGLEMSYQLFDKTTKEPIGRGRSVFETLNKENPISVNQLYAIIQNSPRGKSLGIDKIPIQDVNSSGLDLEMRIIGKALFPKEMHKDRFVIDFAVVENPTVMKKSIHEARANIDRTEKQIGLDLHVGSTAELLQSLIIEEPAIRNLSDYVSNIIMEAKKDAHNMSFSDDSHVREEGVNLMKISNELSNCHLEIEKGIINSNAIPLNLLEQLTVHQYLPENLTSLLLIQKDFQRFIETAPNPNLTSTVQEPIVEKKEADAPSQSVMPTVQESIVEKKETQKIKPVKVEKLVPAEKTKQKMKM